MNSFKPALAEAIGTFFLCFAGISAILCTQAPVSNGAGIVGIALAHGLALSVAVCVFGGISGAHFNPAVTVGMLSVGRIDLGKALQYIGAQLLGAWVAAVVCENVFPQAAVEAAKLGIPLPGKPWEGNVGEVILVEAILTFMLVIAIFGTAIDPRGQAVKIGAFGIGLAVTFDILAGGAITGASMNPARSFGPALALQHFDMHWCYWVGPIAGAVVAAQLYQHVLLDPPAEKK